MATALTLVLAYSVVVLASGRVDAEAFASLFATYLTGAFTVWLLVGLVAAGVVLVLSARSPTDRPAFAPYRDWAVAQWRETRLLTAIAPPVLFALLMTGFNAFKQQILAARPFAWDPILADADRALFGGRDAWRVTHALLGSPNATRVIDGLYHGWFLPMTVGVLACAFLPSSQARLRHQYLLSYCGIWIGLGSALALAVPACGPVFAEAFGVGDGRFAALTERLSAISAAAPLNAVVNQGLLIHLQGSGDLAVGGGISAMPSVHNALAVLFALATFRLNRTAGWFAAAYASVIWIGSIHLGWHYAVDGLASLPLTLAVWAIAGRAADRLLAVDPHRPVRPISIVSAPARL